MYFGLTNLLATFQTMMDHIYHDVILKHKPLGMTIQVYMDNIGIATYVAIPILSTLDGNLTFTTDKILTYL